ncbi:hypothetical protein [Solilutibacter silvestris]|uniref:hypothetical protein n=1 Tax=Solilutibacter silvestris TaxID=1645665 RepID=UPI003D33F662
MKSGIFLAALVLSCMASPAAYADESRLAPMPAQLETRFALSALPPALREGATVWLLDPAKGYRLSRQGTNGVDCLVERTVWEWNELRDDVFVPLCYDKAGSDTLLKVIMDVATLRADGKTAAAIKSEVERRYRAKIYRAPSKAGLSYMVAPLMRAKGPPDFALHTMAMPHLMFYAPGVTNDDIAAKPDLADRASLQWPFVDRQGNAEQSYFIQMVGETEKAKILADETQLVDDLCSWNRVLCLEHAHR